MSHEEQILIRAGTAADAPALARLAALDSAEALLGRMLVAEVDGELRAAFPPSPLTCSRCWPRTLGCCRAPRGGTAAPLADASG